MEFDYTHGPNPSYSSRPDFANGYSKIAFDLVELCALTGSLHDDVHIADLIYKVLLECGHKIQSLQNSYNSFELLSRIGDKIRSHFLKLKQYKLPGKSVSTGILTRLRQIKFKPVAFNHNQELIRQELVLKFLEKTVRAINIWAYNQPNNDENMDRSYKPPPSVNCVKFDQTGNVILTGGDDGMVKLWHSNTGNLIISLSRHPGSITSIDVHWNNVFVASTCDGGECRFWEIQGSWWRLCCTIHSTLKFLWCKFTVYKVSTATCAGVTKDILLCACGYDTLKVYLLDDLTHGREVILKSINLTNLRAYDISSRRGNPWVAVGLESTDFETNGQSSTFGIAAILPLEAKHCGNDKKVKYNFLWDSPDLAMWSELDSLGYLNKLSPSQPFMYVLPGPLSPKYSVILSNHSAENAFENFSLDSSLAIISSSHREIPDVCFANLSRNLITASDDGSAFLWNVYTGVSVKLITKCMESFATRSKQSSSPTSDNLSGPIYTVTCLEWSCDDSMVYIGDSVYSRGNLRKSLSSMRTLESGFSVFSVNDGKLVGHALHKEPNYHLSMIKANPIVPSVALVGSYSGAVYIVSTAISQVQVVKKIECGPGACWLDASWHPKGKMFVLTQKYGCFSIFTLPMSKFAYSSTPLLAYKLDERYLTGEIQAGCFSFGYNRLFSLSATDFVPINPILHPDLLNDSLNLLSGYSSSSLSEPSSMGCNFIVDDLESTQFNIDMRQYINAHSIYNRGFDNIISTFHHLLSGNFDFAKRFHDYPSCPVCYSLFNRNSQSYCQNRLDRILSNSKYEFSEYGDHIESLPPSIKSQLQSLAQSVQGDKSSHVKKKPRMVLAQLLDFNTFDSDDSQDSDFITSPSVGRLSKKKTSVYLTRQSLRQPRDQSLDSSSDTSYENNACTASSRNRNRNKRVKRKGEGNTAVANAGSGVSAPRGGARAKVIQIGFSSIDHLFVDNANACEMCGVKHYCFICGSDVDNAVALGLARNINCEVSTNVGKGDFVMGKLDSTLIGPIVIEKQVVETIISNAAIGDMILEDFKSAKNAVVFLHHYCLATIDSVVYLNNGISGLDRALYKASETKCTFCSRNGATLCCKNCNNPYHARCSFKIYEGCKIYPNALVGEFICANCSKSHAIEYMNGTLFADISRDWIYADPFFLQMRSTRSRLKSQLAFKRIAGRGDEWILPQRGDILWFNSLDCEAKFTNSDRIIPLYLHYTHLPFAALVSKITLLFSGYKVNMQHLVLKLHLIILPPHPCSGVTISIYSHRGDQRYTLLNKLIIGLYVQSILGEDDNVLISGGDKPGELKQARVLRVNNKCRRFLEFDSYSQDIVKHLDRAIQNTRGCVRVRLNKRDNRDDGYIVRQLVMQSTSGWELEPTGEALASAGLMAEKLLDVEFSKEKKEFYERLLCSFSEKFQHEEHFGELFNGHKNCEDGEWDRESLAKLPRPVRLQDIKQALADGLFRQPSSVDELITLMIDNAEAYETNQVKLDFIRRFKEYYQSLNPDIASEDPECSMQGALDRLKAICKIAFIKNTR